MNAAPSGAVQPTCRLWGHIGGVNEQRQIRIHHLKSFGPQGRGQALGAGRRWTTPPAWRDDMRAAVAAPPPPPPGKDRSCSVRMSAHDYERLGILAVKTGVRASNC